jgi:hypothetical protein
MNLQEVSALTSSGHALDLSESSFGELRDSSWIAGDHAALRGRMEEDGYLYIRGFFERDEVLAARRSILEQAEADGLLEPGADLMDGIPRTDARGTAFHPEYANTPEVHAVLYGERLLDFYRGHFGEEVRHYDFTWLRYMGKGDGTKPHCDVVYMGRGEREQLRTAWIPMGDASLSLGGLMILEGSHLQHERIRHYLERDVDTYCTNGRHAPEIESGKKAWEWDGVLSTDPVSLREKLGGRWLTTEFTAGDLLTFTVHTVHASIDNRLNRLRISTDSRYQPASKPADERWIGRDPVGHGLAGKRGRIC